MDVKLSRERKADIKEAVKTYKAARGTAAARTDRATMQVETGKALPSSSPPYRLAHVRRPIVQKEIKEMLRKGIIQPSHSPWAAPIILVPKKDGSLRICVDYRKLNAATSPDPFPIPRVEDLLDGMSSAKFITILDLARGYWQVPMEPASRGKTAFSTDFGKYEFMVMPFGLVGAPATFQRLMNELFGDLHGKVAVYMDDLAIYSETWEDHLLQLPEVLKRLAEAGLQIKMEKCQFGMTSCEAKVSAIQDFKIPKRKKDLKAFLGLAGYCRRFVPHYADIAAPRSGWLLQAFCTTLCRHCCSSVWLVTAGVLYHTMQTLLLLGLAGYCRHFVPHYADIAAPRSGWLLQAFCTTLCRHCCSSVWLVTAGILYHTMQTLLLLGLAGYYRRFVPHYADIAAPRSGWLLQAFCTTLCRHCCSSVWLVTTGVLYHTMQTLLLLGLDGYCRHFVPHYADIAAPRSG